MFQTLYKLSQAGKLSEMKNFVERKSEEISEQLNQQEHYVPSPVPENPQNEEQSQKDFSVEVEEETAKEDTGMSHDKFGFVSKGTPTSQDDSMAIECIAPIGIANCGNTCYAAATLQVFEHLYVVLGRNKPEVDMSNFDNEQNDACETLGRLLNMFPIAECEVVIKSSVICTGCN